MLKDCLAQLGKTLSAKETETITKSFESYLNDYDEYNAGVKALADFHKTAVFDEMTKLRKLAKVPPAKYVPLAELAKKVVEQDVKEPEQNTVLMSKADDKRQAKLDKLAKPSKPRSAPKADATKHSLSVFVQRQGGIKSGGVIDVSAVKNAKGGNFIIGKNRLDVEDAFRNAVEAGYFAESVFPN